MDEMDEMNKNQLTKLYKIELDIYERYYVTVNNLEYIIYSKQYVDGYLGKLPEHSCIKESSVYIRKLLLLFDRVKETFKLFVPTQFNKRNVVQLYWKIIDDVSTMNNFLRSNSKFIRIYKEKINNFEEEMNREENILHKTSIPLKNIKCIKNKIQRIHTFTY
jgi:hypothetical protein